jgi:hypothetical protein
VPARTIRDVVSRMRAIDKSCAHADGVACFTRLYLEVTEGVRAAVRQTTFRDPRFVARLDVVFAGLFFAAVDGKPSHAWAPLFEARGRTGIAPLQFALAGMNAHINRDLPVALVATCSELGLDLERAGPQHADYTSVNRLLAAAEKRAKRDLVTGAAALGDEALGRLDDRAAMWNVARAREAAWVQARALWALRGIPPLRDRWLDALDRTVGFAGRGLLQPIV